MFRALAALAAAALAVAACGTAQQPAAPQSAPPLMRTLGGDTPCPPEFAGTCYPVWFGTNRKPIDPSDPSKGYGSDFDEQVHYGKRIVRIPVSHKPGELGSPLWRRVLMRTDDRLKVDPATELSEDAFTR